MALDKQPEAVFSVIIEPHASGAAKTAGDTIGVYRKKSDNDCRRDPR